MRDRSTELIAVGPGRNARRSARDKSLFDGNAGEPDLTFQRVRTRASKSRRSSNVRITEAGLRQRSLRDTSMPARNSRRLLMEDASWDRSTISPRSIPVAALTTHQALQSLTVDPRRVAHSPGTLGCNRVAQRRGFSVLNTSAWQGASVRRRLEPYDDSAGSLAQVHRRSRTPRRP
jgi:hypothetical protein